MAPKHMVTFARDPFAELVKPLCFLLSIQWINNPHQVAASIIDQVHRCPPPSKRERERESKSGFDKTALSLKKPYHLINQSTITLRCLPPPEEKGWFSEKPPHQRTLISMQWRDALGTASSRDSLICNNVISVAVINIQPIKAKIRAES